MGLQQGFAAGETGFNINSQNGPCRLSVLAALQFRARAGFAGDGFCGAWDFHCYDPARVSIRYLVGVKRRLRTIFGRSGLRRCGGRHPELVVFADDSKNLCYNARMQSR